MYGQIKIPPEKNAPQSLHGEDHQGDLNGDFFGDLPDLVKIKVIK